MFIVKISYTRNHHHLWKRLPMLLLLKTTYVL